MMELALARFFGRNRIHPKRVIFFRDGVSEGEYNTVATTELAAIKGTLTFNLCLTFSRLILFALAAIKAIVKDEISVTFIVVGKR